MLAQQQWQHPRRHREGGRQLPLGIYVSGNYCLSSPSNDREAIHKTGSYCPLGWFSSGSYCVKNR